MSVNFFKSVKYYLTTMFRHSDSNNFTTEQIHLKKLQEMDYSLLELDLSTEKSISVITSAAKKIYGNKWNYYSNALRREVVKVFETCIQHLLKSRTTINYLEIGSCQGLSMSLIARLLNDVNSRGKLVSIDPYFETGYIEGALGIWEKDLEIAINKSTRDKAYALYNLQQLDVIHIEETSTVGLKSLVTSNQQFDLIYIDGSHEGLIPLRDLGLSLELIKPGGIIILDDHHWPDVKVIKELCDKHYLKIGESWKVAAYLIAPIEVDSNNTSLPTV